MRHDPYQLGVTLGQILTTVQRTDRSMMEIRRLLSEREKPSKLEQRLKDWCGIATFLATLYLTGSLHDSVKAFLSASVP